jgi:hypothetical protein
MQPHNRAAAPRVCCGPQGASGGFRGPQGAAGGLRGPQGASGGPAHLHVLWLGEGAEHIGEGG